MKSITSFINESLSKLNLDGIHYSITPYKWNRKMRCAGEDHPEAGAEAYNCITEEISGRAVLDKREQRILLERHQLFLLRLYRFRGRSQR